MIVNVAFFLLFFRLLLVVLVFSFVCLKRFIRQIHNSSDNVDISFLSLRIGTKDGIVTHKFRAETKRDFDYWTNRTRQCLQSAVMRTKEVVFRTLFKRFFFFESHNVVYMI